ncbi:MAG: 30S ribosomal protein S4e [Candidatus Woesearchaeota archaeon]
MTKNHLKRINMPRTWQVKRKGIQFVTRPNPGQSSFLLGTSLTVLLRDILGAAKTLKEVKYILNNGEVAVNTVIRKEPRFIVGFFDVISLPKIKKDYRIILNNKGKISLIEIDGKEADIKLIKITGKSFVKGKLQLNLSDGRNILTDKKECKVGETIVFNMKKKEIIDILKLEKGACIFLIRGKHLGEEGKITNIHDINITYKNENGEPVETRKKYAIVIGKDKSLIKLK